MPFLNYFFQTQTTVTMTAETAALPINITINMGDVSFILTPSPESPSPRRQLPRKASPSQRRRPLRTNNTEPTSSPILSIRQSPISSSTPRSIHKSTFVSPGHVRGIKERFESQQQENQRRSSILSSQVAADNGTSTTGNGYFVDLNSFTGTLQIKQNDVQLKPKKVYSPMKRASVSQYDNSTTNRRVKKRSLTPPVKQSRKENNDIDEIHDNATKKSVQFSLTSNEEELSRFGNDIENKDNTQMRNENNNNNNNNDHHHSKTKPPLF